MQKSLEELSRNRIPDNRNYNEGIFLNRAERVEPFNNKLLEEIFNYNNFSNLGNYYTSDSLYIKYSKYLNIKVDELLITNGAEEAIRYIFNIFLKPGDKIMFPNPTYGMYHVYSRMYQVDSIILDYDDDFKINKNKLYENLSKVKVLFLPNPSHIEDLFDKNEIIKISEILKEKDSYLVVDETYFGFGSQSMINLINDYNNIFIIRSFSKTFGLPSIRVGCLIGNKKKMNFISNYRPAYEIAYPSLKISEYFLDNIYIVDNYINDCISGRNYLVSNLIDNNIKFNGTNNYLLNISIGNAEICKKICDSLEEKFIYVRNCNKYISITIGPKKFMEKFYSHFIDNYKKLTIKGEYDFLFKEDSDGKLNYIATDDTFNDIYKNNINAWNQNINDDYMLFARNKIVDLIKKFDFLENKMLEIGCGNGFSTNFFKQKLNTTCYGCDISKIAIEYANSKYNDINFFEQNIKNKIKIKDKFNIIIFSDILWYIFEDIDICISNALENLTNDGIIIFNNSMCVNQKYGKDKINGSSELVAYFKKKFNVINHFESEFIDRRNLCLITIKKYF